MVPVHYTQHLVPASTYSSSLLFSSLELSDTQVSEPEIRALLGTASHFCEVVVLTSRTHHQDVVIAVGPPLCVLACTHLQGYLAHKNLLPIRITRLSTLLPPEFQDVVIAVGRPVDGVMWEWTQMVDATLKVIRP